MKKKIIFSLIILSLIITLPAFAGNATVTPEIAESYNNQQDNTKNDFTTNDVYDYDGNTIEVIELGPDQTRILMNDTYQLDVTHNDTDIGVNATQLDTGGLSIDADVNLFNVNYHNDETGQSLDIDLIDFGIEIQNSGDNSDLWEIAIFGFSDLTIIEYNTTSGDLYIFDGINEISMKNEVIIINGGTGPTGLIISRFNESAWDILTPHNQVFLNYNAGAGYFGIEINSSPLTDGSIPSSPTTFTPPPVSIYFFENGFGIEWAGVTIYIHAFMLVLIFDYFTITWYFGLIVAHLVILIWDLTLIFYLTVVDLILVIIYYTFEIKIYYTQIVIVYEIIEILIVFVSLTIWEFTFIFHFEFWFIQILFIVQINILIIQPVRLIFVPILVPIFIPVIFYVPVFITNTIHVYVPYASPALYIDVYDEDLQTPNHTIQYQVTDQTGLPVDDATVNVAYNGTDYSATFVANGIYEVQLPASEEQEAISVTASKSWYPDGTLDYTLNVTWVVATITPSAPLPLIPIIASLFSLALGTVLIRKRKK